ncbi:non-ribosomal peptide synthetase [Nocardia brevicatena]|uniref:non-ribosomal peptide synthetase n=1 Tax=Nocardia brevicatena TaxID=37327 RepID=UPI0006874198|nr:non-ribosomal peptide synthetase [Nocardia brevicatena]
MTTDDIVIDEFAARTADRAYWAERLAGAPRPEEPRVAPIAHEALPLPGSARFGRLARSGGGAGAVVLAALAVYGQRLGGEPELTLGHRDEFGLVPIRARVSPYTSFETVVREIGVELRRARRHRFRADFDDPWPARHVRRWALSAECTDGRWHIGVPGAPEAFVRLFHRLVAESGSAVGGVTVSDARETAGGGAGVANGRPDVEGGRAVPDEPVTLPAAFEEQVRRTPEAIALRTASETMSYTELDARANRWARRLVRAGVGPETVVAVAVPRSVEAVVAVYAIVKAGAAFLQLDPELPPERLAHILETARPVALPGLSDGADAPVRVLRAEHLVALDRLAAAEDDSAPRFALRGDNLAYVMFTSGSSGRPKGVAVTHTAIRNQLSWMQHRFGLGTGDIVLQKTATTFDVSLWEVLWPLQVGAQLVIAPPAAHLDPAETADLIRRFAVTTVQFVPSTLRLFADEHTVAPGVRRILVAGEVFAPEQARWAAAGPAEVANLYGPTETCVAVTAHRVRADETETVPIGAPVWNIRCHVLDAALHPVPEGVAGELYLSGVQLARGYLHRPGETAGRFVADPFGAAGGLLYRTGDIVRRRDGELEFLGRNDFQVKLRGLRIELGDVEAALLADDAVSAAVAVAGDGRLHGYIVPAGGHAPDLDALRRALAERLPAYMLPHTLTALDALPLTPLGKTDRRALPEPRVDTAAYQAPEGPVAETLATVYAEILGRERVGAHDSFFALGGDSIMSILLVSRAKARGIALTAQQVFEHRTPAALAAAAQGAAVTPALEELPGGGVGEMPLPPAASYLVERGGGWRRFAQAMVLELPIGITRPQLLTTLTAVLDRHDMLRSRLYRDAGGRRRLFADATGSVHADEIVHRVGFDPAIDTDAFTALAAAELDTALGLLDPAEGVVVRFVWLDPETERGGRSGRLIFLVHHIAVDGVSWRILVPDLIAAWAQVAAGRTPILPDVATSMRRWTHALVDEARRESRTAELAYWREVVDGDDPPLADRPFDPARDLASTTHYTQVELDEHETAALVSALPQRYYAGANEILLTALVLAVASWRPRESVLVRLEGHGREPDIAPGADISRTVGWFTALYPVGFRLGGLDIADALSGGASLGEVVKTAKEQIRAVPGRGIGYGLLRYANPATAAALPREEPGQIVFNYLGNIAATAVPDEFTGVGWVPASDLSALPRTPDPDMPAAGALELDLIVVAGRLRVTIGHPESLLARVEAAEFVERFGGALRVMADHAERAVGGHTPSDFPLVPVGRSDIEQWEHRYPGLVDIWPLGPMQSGLFFHALYSGRTVDPYTLQLVVTLTGSVDAGRLRAAARAVLAAHPSLRTAFHADHVGTLVAVVLDSPALPWTEIDMDPGTDIDALLEADRTARFDFTRPPLIRFTLVRFGSESAKLVVTSHHIVFDGWSVPILMQDLLTHYAMTERLDDGHAESGIGGDARAALPPRPSYRDYLEWLTRQDRTAAERAWRAALSGAEPTILASSPIPGPSTAAPLEQMVELDEADSRRIADIAAELDVTVNTVLQAAWAIVLGALTGRTDIVFGATVSGRPADLPGVETMVGLFINTVPVRVRIDPAEQVTTLLQRLQEEQAALVAHHHLGLTAIQACVGDGSRELFDTLLVFESYPFDPGLVSTASHDGLSIAGFESHEATHFPLSLSVWSGVGAVPRVGAANRLRITASHWPARFSADTVRVILDRLTCVLISIGTRPADPIVSCFAPAGAPTRSVSGIGPGLDAEDR